MAGYTVSSVTSGKYARQISVAASGPQGAQGPAGPQGVKGDTGIAGGLSARYKFLNSYSAADPGVGYLAFNNSAFMAATELYVSASDMATDNQNALLAAATASTSTNKSIVTLQKVSDPRKFSRFYVTGGTNNTGWWDLQLEYIGGTALSWAYNDQIDVLVAPVGDMGSTGAVGPTGPAGQGVPTGGLQGQILRKLSNSDYATEWVDPEAVQDVALNELTDVNLETLTDGQVLVYNQSSNEWLPVSPESLPQSTNTLSGTIEGGSASTF